MNGLTKYDRRSLRQGIGGPARDAADSLEELVGDRPTGNAAVTSVAYNASNATLLNATPARMGAYFFNDTDKAAYIKLGATATTSDFTVKVAAGAGWALPFSYVGKVDYIGEGGGTTGAVHVTEFS